MPAASRGGHDPRGDRSPLAGDADVVASGLASTARVITCAALTMASVFLSFLLSTNVVVKMLALGPSRIGWAARRR